MTSINFSQHTSPLFDCMTTSEIHQLLHCIGAHTKEYEKGAVIILEEDNVQYIGVILKGKVGMMKNDIWGNETVLTYITDGHLIGESFAVQHQIPSYVTFIAVETTYILFLPANRIIHPCPNGCAFHHQIATNLFRLLGQKSILLMEKIELSSKPSMREKILAYLSMQSQKQNSNYITLPLNRTQMASYLGVNRSAMSRELSAMKEEGLIDYEGKTLLIKEHSTLSSK